MNTNETHVTLWFYDQVDAPFPDPTLRRGGQADLSRCVSGQPPGAQGQGTSQTTRMAHLSQQPVSCSPPGAPLAAVPQSLTDTEKGPVQSFSKPGSQTQKPSGVEYHYWLYVTQMVSGARRWTLQWVCWVWGTQPSIVIAATRLHGSGSYVWPSMTGGPWGAQWQKENGTCQNFLLLLQAHDLQLHGLPLHTRQRCVCANPDTFNHMCKFLCLQYGPGQSLTKGGPPLVQRE